MNVRLNSNCVRYEYGASRMGAGKRKAKPAAASAKAATMRWSPSLVASITVGLGAIFGAGFLRLRSRAPRPEAPRARQQSFGSGERWTSPLPEAGFDAVACSAIRMLWGADLGHNL